MWMMKMKPALISGRHPLKIALSLAFMGAQQTGPDDGLPAIPQVLVVPF